MDFSVPNIQLEYYPGNINLGRRRTSVQKNDSSFKLSNLSYTQAPQQIRWFREELNAKNAKIENLEKANIALRAKLQDSQRRKNNDQYRKNLNPFLKDQSSLLLGQPIFTKRHPKVVLTDPFYNNFSPRMSNIGERLLNHKNLSF